jgi:hypothetical protein
MERTNNSDYGKLKGFQLLLSPAGNNTIFVGVNRLVSIGLIDGEQYAPEYPCQVANRFQCPYDRTDVEATNSDFDVDHLFRLQKMAFVVEIALAKARKASQRLRQNVRKI